MIINDHFQLKILTLTSMLIKHDQNINISEDPVAQHIILLMQ